MKAAILLKIGAELLKMMSICDLRVQDVEYIELYAQYVKARNNHEKYNVIIYELANQHHLSESTVKRIIRRFEKEV